MQLMRWDEKKAYLASDPHQTASRVDLVNPHVLNRSLLPSHTPRHLPAFENLFTQRPISNASLGNKSSLWSCYKHLSGSVPLPRGTAAAMWFGRTVTGGPSFKVVPFHNTLHSNSNSNKWRKWTHVVLSWDESVLTWNPFPLVMPVTSTNWPGTKWRTPREVPRGTRASSVTGNSLSFLFMGTPWARKWPTSGFVKCFSFFCPHPI